MESGRLSLQGRKRKQPDAHIKSPPGSKRRLQHQRRFDFDAQVQDYKIWRRQGAWHDPLCLECRKPDDLILCQTCKRAYHKKCIPKSSSFASRTHKLYCVVCVELGWDVSPPDFSDFASPEPAPAGGSDYLRLQGRDSEALHSGEDIARPVVEHESMVEQPVVLAATHSPSFNAPTIEAQTQHVAKEPVESTQPSGETALAQSVALSTHDDLWSRYQGKRGYSQRRSKFATLPSKIDECLSTLYQELEASSSLRQTISELEMKVRGLEQETQIQKNQLILMEQSPAGTYISDQELAEMRALISQGKLARAQLEELTNSHNTLQAEYNRQGADLLAKDDALREWKGKLKTLLGE